MSRVGRWFALAAFVEAVTWAGLLVGMFFKYVVEAGELGVQIFGPLHGAAFVGYIAITIAAAISLRWRRRITLVSLLAAIPPLVTVPLEVWLRRRGELSAPCAGVDVEALGSDRRDR